MPEVASDIEIARAAELRPIEEIALKLDIPPDALYRYGPHKAKLSYDFITSLADRPKARSPGRRVFSVDRSPRPLGA